MTQVSEDRDRLLDGAARDEPTARPRPVLTIQRPSSAGLAGVVEALLGGDLPIAVVCYDGTRAGPAEAPATDLRTSRRTLTLIVLNDADVVVDGRVS